MHESPITITDSVIQEVLEKDDISLVEVDLHIPSIDGLSKKARTRVARFYRSVTQMTVHFAKTALLENTANNWGTAAAQGSAMQTAACRSRYSITLQNEEYLSLYRDMEIICSDGSGRICRFGDTWDLKTGWSVPLCRFFPQDVNLRKTLRAFFAEQTEYIPDSTFKCRISISHRTESPCFSILVQMNQNIFTFRYIFIT